MTKSSFPVGRASALAALLLCACITGGGHPHPLYPDPETPRPAGEVARLSGPVATVDDQDVSKFGKSFALLPGCHVVKLAAKTGTTSGDGRGGYVTSLPPTVYAFRMQAQHAYEIDVRFDGRGGPTVGNVTIQAWDRDANGGAVEVAPVGDGAEVEDCLNWAP